MTILKIIVITLLIVLSLRLYPTFDSGWIFIFSASSKIFDFLGGG